MNRSVSRGRTAGSKERAGGVKPTIAFTAEKVAVENMRKKLGLLVEALGNKGPFIENDGELALACLPLTTRQFNLWSSSVLPEGIKEHFEEFRANGNKTLGKYPDLRKSVEQAIAALRIHRDEKKKPRTPREVTVENLRAESRLQKTLRQIGERELIKSRRLVIKYLARISHLEDELLSHRKHAETVGDLHHAEIEALNAKNAALVEMLYKVRALRPVDGQI